MNNSPSCAQPVRASFEPDFGRHSNHMLCELLALNEEMIEQFRRERLTVMGTANFLTGMIEQHEKAAALLRLQLEDHAVDAV